MNSVKKKLQDIFLILDGMIYIGRADKDALVLLRKHLEDLERLIKKEKKEKKKSL